MDGLLVAWSGDEIQAVDETNFQTVVVDVTERFFSDVDVASSVTVVWETLTRDHRVRYDVTQEPQLGLDSCYIDIEGGRGGEYRLELDPDSLSIRQHSNDRVEELTYLELRAPGVAVDTETNRLSLPEIPEQLKKKAVRAAPQIDW